MRALLFWSMAIAVALGGTSLAQSAGSPEKDMLIGAWHLLSMEEPGPDGKLTRVTNRKGMLLYTSDGHMSVQIMFPTSDSALSNDYVRNGYEASFGSYEVNEAAHTVTHHVQGSITAKLVGQHLTRVYQFSGKHLIIKSTRPDEHWSVTWEHE